MQLRIMFLGENWFGSCARACSYALRRAGCEVLDLDAQTIVPQWKRRSNRAVARLLFPRIVREYNEQLLAAAAHFRPDMLLAFKGSLVQSATLDGLRASGIALYNYFPDTIPAEHGAVLARSIAAYDCVFYTKKFWAAHPPAGLQGRNLVFLPHGYDPDVHRPVSLDDRDVAEDTHDVTVIANHTAYKQRVLTELMELRPKLDLQIYGDGWGAAGRLAQLRGHVRGFAVTGTTYAKVICAARINLAITSWTGRVEIDETTTRTYEIPACGGFMLHERTPELLELYREGSEVVAFGSVEELAGKIDHYLARPDERAAIAQAGHLRCVPAYSYDRRVRQILDYHLDRHREDAARGYRGAA